ncbi:hypothetical protein S2L_21 [Cyanophage S-2L]|nr:hypothetical protein S2L_21 [Cyanophage S-2L]
MLPHRLHERLARLRDWALSHPGADCRLWCGDRAIAEARFEDLLGMLAQAEIDCFDRQELVLQLRNRATIKVEDMGVVPATCSSQPPAAARSSAPGRAGDPT